MKLTNEDVQEIVKLVDNSAYDELHIETDSFTLTLRRTAAGDWTREQTVSRAPVLGTFYRAPSPGAAPFVEIGSRVEPATVVGIIETMKLMNAVHAGAAGV